MPRLRISLPAQATTHRRKALLVGGAVVTPTLIELARLWLAARSITIIAECL